MGIEERRSVQTLPMKCDVVPRAEIGKAELRRLAVMSSTYAVLSSVRVIFFAEEDTERTCCRVTHRRNRRGSMSWLSTADTQRNPKMKCTKIPLYRILRRLGWWKRRRDMLLHRPLKLPIEALLLMKHECVITALDSLPKRLLAKHSQKV